MAIEVRYDDAAAIGAGAYHSGRMNARNQTLARMSQQKAAANRLEAQAQQAALDRRHQLKMNGLRQDHQVDLADRQAIQKSHYSKQRHNQAKKEMEFREDLAQGRVEFASEQAEVKFRRNEQKINEALANGIIDEDQRQQALTQLYTGARIQSRSSKKKDEPAWKDPQARDHPGRPYLDPKSGALLLRNTDGSVKQIKDTYTEERSRRIGEYMAKTAGALGPDGKPIPFERRLAEAKMIADAVTGHMRQPGQPAPVDQSVGPSTGLEGSLEIQIYERMIAKETDPIRRAAIQEMLDEARSQASAPGEVTADPEAGPTAGRESSTTAGGDLPASTYDSKIDRGTLDPPNFPESTGGMREYENWARRRSVPPLESFSKTDLKGEDAELMSNWGDTLGMLHSGDQATVEKARDWIRRNNLVDGPKAKRVLLDSIGSYKRYLDRYRGREKMARLGLIEPHKKNSKARDQAAKDYERALAALGKHIRAKQAIAAGGPGMDDKERRKLLNVVHAEGAIARFGFRDLVKKHPVLFTHEKALDLSDPSRVVARVEARKREQAELEQRRAESARGQKQKRVGEILDKTGMSDPFGTVRDFVGRGFTPSTE